MKMDPHLRNYQKNKSQISGKRQWILLLEIEKKERKTLNTFQKLLKKISQSHQ